MPQIQRDSIPRRVQKLLGLEGSSPVPTISPELVGVVTCADASDPVWWDPNSQRIAGAYVNAAAGGAGVFSYADLVNPAGSKVLIEVTEILVHAASALEFIIKSLVDGTLTPTGYGYYRDTRISGQAIGGTKTGAITPVTGSTIARIRTHDTGTTIYTPKIIVGPGDACRVSIATANTAGNVSFSWTEYLNS